MQAKKKEKKKFTIDKNEENQRDNPEPTERRSGPFKLSVAVEQNRV